jgi:8-oxo-dGTP pyrophosphatase MutT (NUDIX family)
MNILEEQKQLANRPITNYLVGCAGIIFDEDGNLLVGERVDFDGRRVIAVFGGKPEYDETLAAGLSREILEELGLLIDPKRWHLIRMREASPGVGKHCVTAFFAVKINNSEKAGVRNMEPHKCKQLIWDRVDTLTRAGIWQQSEPEIIQAFSQMFGRFRRDER